MNTNTRADIPINPPHPLAEVFGYAIDDNSSTAKRYRKLKLCPFNNKVPNCTKDKADNPLGLCSIYRIDGLAITCPVRFRQQWVIAEHAAEFFFPEGTAWTTLLEVRLNDKNGVSAGNIDLVLVAYDSKGKVTDFGAVEIQGVYISGNIRNAFDSYMEQSNPGNKFSWKNKPNYPRPDYLSSSRKRLVPQLIYKGGILNAWNKKLCVTLDDGFFNTLPELKETPKTQADIAWNVYDLELENEQKQRTLTRKKVIYTAFSESLDNIAKPQVGQIDDFIEKLQAKLDEKLENGSKPETKTIDLGN